jgi:hypothetical protein
MDGTQRLVGIRHEDAVLQSQSPSSDPSLERIITSIAVGILSACIFTAAGLPFTASLVLGALLTIAICLPFRNSGATTSPHSHSSTARQVPPHSWGAGAGVCSGGALPYHDTQPRAQRARSPVAGVPWAYSHQDIPNPVEAPDSRQTRWPPPPSREEGSYGSFPRGDGETPQFDSRVPLCKEFSHDRRRGVAWPSQPRAQAVPPPATVSRAPFSGNRSLQTGDQGHVEAGSYGVPLPIPRGNSAQSPPRAGQDSTQLDGPPARAQRVPGS